MVYSLIALEGKGNESGLGENRVHIDGLPGNSIVFLFALKNAYARYVEKCRRNIIWFYRR